MLLAKQRFCLEINIFKTEILKYQKKPISFSCLKENCEACREKKKGNNISRAKTSIESVHKVDSSTHTSEKREASPLKSILSFVHKFFVAINASSDAF